MAQTPLTESWHDFGFMVSQARGHRSVDQGVASGAVLIPAGSVVAKTAAGKFVPLAPAASDGTQNAIGIIGMTTDTTLADKKAPFVVRDAEVNASELIWPASITGPQTTAALAQLAALGIIAR
ncbi:head decoration protein [Caballeronia sp. LZ033]|uniref:head decoration protein n=1 Tax=Caballeronia sp. LZ033 TaxID=3038566 RepID=UPI00285B72B8|nr:head decoration protein [Caballeronia sp. LZ033]MDR5813323.1 head decoration protein [Caballeronia sp. LZ033]